MHRDTNVYFMHSPPPSEECVTSSADDGHRKETLSFHWPSLYLCVSCKCDCCKRSLCCTGNFISSKS